MTPDADAPRVVYASLFRLAAALDIAPGRLADLLGIPAARLAASAPGHPPSARAAVYRRALRLSWILANLDHVAGPCADAQKSWLDSLHPVLGVRPAALLASRAGTDRLARLIGAPDRQQP